MPKENILIIEDEKEIADLIEIYLVNEGYEVYKAYSGEEGLKVLAEQQIQLVILDIMMPGIDGLEVCRIIRRDKNIPILMLSAKSEDMDKILGLSTGADDYLTKPFNPLELLARVKSQLRRYLYLNPNYKQNNAEREDIITIDSLVINKSKHTVSVNDREVKLTPTEFQILLLLAGHRKRVFSAEEIFERIWDEPCYESRNTVMVHIRNIREKIEDNPREPRFIKTVWGVGYKIE
ncbi:MAG: response regulator transcription factor [Thermacetogeniaceae bacterium]|jgi:DNA-binding response OmpR family regulator|nr:response regulator transcription factor [Thermoanaerobacterales bacterium]NLN21364.1 response regulator transcription factor [Syntrophomonadaceae bacterium]